MKVARPENQLMQGVATHFLAGLSQAGSEAVVEITREANRRGVPLENLPYVFWALDTQSGLPRLPEPLLYELLMLVMRGTGTMPPYWKSFVIAEDAVTDEAVSAIALHMSRWAKKTMLPLASKAYQAALRSQVAQVPRATGGRVPAAKAGEFLSRAFPRVLSVESRSFARGDLLRRVVRSLAR